MINKPQKVGLKDFIMLDNDENRLEFIDGEVHFLSSPSVEHQRILLNLAAGFKIYFSGKPCETFIAPLDVWLKNEETASNNKVQPDLMVICGKTGLDENSYTGVPSLIIEIMSPSNYSHDRIKKYNLYMDYGVKEYWLVNPKLKTIEIYILSEGEYKQAGIYKGNENAMAQSFENLSVNLNDIFG